MYDFANRMISEYNGDNRDYKDSSYKNGISDEVTWFKTANTSAAWTRYHFQRSQHTRKPDISAIFPSIDVLVRTLDAQHHCMEIVEKTVQLLIKVISRYVSYQSSFNGDCSIDLKYFSLF